MNYETGQGGGGNLGFTPTKRWGMGPGGGRGCGHSFSYAEREEHDKF